MREKDYWELVSHIGDPEHTKLVKVHTSDGATWEGIARPPAYGLVRTRARLCCVSLPGQNVSNIYLDIRHIIAVQTT